MNHAQNQHVGWWYSL